MNKQLQQDRFIVRKIIRTTPFQNLITSTWNEIIMSNNPLPKNWATVELQS
jgi:hypothetical protein